MAHGLLKYIFKDKDGVWQLDEYFKHLDSISSRIPAALRELIQNENRYVPSSRQSFHDAWLSSLKLLGPQECEPRKVFAIEIVLLGPYHDRLFELTYLSADNYKIELPAVNGLREKIEYRGAMKYKDDLAIHEFDLSKEGNLEHRLLFDSGLTISICCADILFEERFIENVEQGD